MVCHQLVSFFHIEIFKFCLEKDEDADGTIPLSKVKGSILKSVNQL